MKKTLSLILAMLMLLSAFTACSEGGTAAEDTTAAVSDTVDSASDAPAAEDTEAEPAETTREDVKDGLGDYNFNGTSFRAAQPESSSYEFYAEELTGESTNDAVYNRNLRVEERFNAEIETINFANTTAVLTEVNNLVASGSDAFEVATHVAYKAYTPIGNGAYRNWYDVPTVDFTRPWWNNLANTQNTINGILYTATGDINITSLLNTYAMFFNMEVAANFGIMAADLYNYVYEGTWTIDKMIELTSSIYVDENGDGIRDNGDTYGYAAWPGISSDAWLAAFDQPISTKDDEGFPQAAIMTDKTVAALEKIYNFYYNTDGALGTTSALVSAEYEVTMFVNNQVVMVPSIFNDAFTEYRHMDATYGIIPYPKWDEAQSQYLTNARDQYTVIGIPLSKTDDSLEFIGVITEALAAESWKTVFPEYYNVALKGKYSSDRDTANMVDLVLAGRNFDFAFLFGEQQFQRLPYFFRDLLAAGDTNFASKYAKIEKALNKTLGKIREFYGYEG
ncbi:MAG: hypothetical protein J6D10_05580 [Clostridia bacterium]|nr:hypothetical protein [Oscillospiraceae bacterium]MBO5127023.1 hypothetical protein [Clostridia bacterium]MBQ7313283.1 hypothetical protein [Clostridia bacterium]